MNTNKDYMSYIYKAYRASGLPAKQFAFENGVNEKDLNRIIASSVNLSGNLSRPYKS